MPFALCPLPFAIYSICHDLINPLSVIHGLLSILELKLGDKLTDSDREILSVIAHSTTKMKTLVTDLLYLPKQNKNNLNLDHVNLAELVTKINLDLQLQYPDRQFNTITDVNIWAKCDRNLINIVLSNLVANSWKYSVNNNILIIQFGVYDQNINEELKEKIFDKFAMFYEEEEALDNPDNFPVYFLKDNGVGFDINQADVIFKPFYRLHQSNFPGTGIGLNTVHRIIEVHGGKIWCDSQPNQGATFYFTLGT